MTKVQIKIRHANTSDRAVYYKCLSDKRWRVLFGFDFPQEKVNEYVNSFAPLNSYELDCFILELNSNSIGFVNLLKSRDDIITLSGGLLPEKLNNGWGITYYAHMINYAMSLTNTKKISTFVTKTNLSSIRMHKALGFKIDTTKNDYDRIFFTLTKEDFFNFSDSSFFMKILNRRSCEVSNEK